MVPTTFAVSGRLAANWRGNPTNTKMMSSVAVVNAITRYRMRSERSIF